MYETKLSLSPKITFQKSPHRILVKNGDIENSSLSSITVATVYDYVSSDMVVHKTKNSKIETFDTTPKQKLNPLAKPFYPEWILKENNRYPFSQFLENNQIDLIQPTYYSPDASEFFECSLLNFTPFIINDARTSDISMKSDLQNETFDQTVVAEISDSPGVSPMINGIEESASSKTIVDPKRLRNTDLNVNVSTDLVLNNVQFFDSESEISLFSSKSNSNSLASPIEFSNTNLINNQFHMIHSQVNHVASESDVCTSGPFQISDSLLDCTPRIINDAETPDISMRSD